MSGSDLHGSWEVSVVPARLAGGTGKVEDRNPVIHIAEKSDTPIVLGKPPNKGEPAGELAEAVEGRGVAEGNAGEATTSRTQSREPVSKGLEGIREAAKRDGQGNTHPYPEERFRVKHPRQEPCAVIPLAGICAGGRG